MFCKKCGHPLEPGMQVCPKCGQPVENGKKTKRWISVAIVVVAVLFVLVLALIGIVAAKLWLGNDPAEDTQTREEAAAQQLLDQINEKEKQWVDDNGYVAPEDLEACLDAVYQEVNDSRTVIYCEKNDYCVYFECEDDMGYVYIPELEELSAGGDDLQIVTVQPYFTENLTKDTYGRYDHDALDSAAQQISSNYEMWSFYSNAEKTDDNIDNDELTIERLFSLEDYKMILWQGHGGYTQKRGFMACTTTQVTRQLKKEYEQYFKNKYLVKSIKGTLYVTESFFAHCFPDNAFDGAVIYIATCLSGYTRNLADILVAKGAAAVFVNSDSIYRDYNLNMVRAVGENLCYGDTVTQALENAKIKHGACDARSGIEVYVYCVAQPWAKDLTLQQLSHVIPMTPWKEAYVNLLNYDVLPHATEDMPFREYTLYDMDLDGIPECIVDYGTCEADRSYRIYTAQDNAYVYLGTVSSSHSMLYGELDGSLTVMSGHMEEETCRTVTIENWTALEEAVYSRRVKRYWDERCQMQPLTMYDLTDFSAFHWNGNPDYDNRAALNTEEPAPTTPVPDVPVPDVPAPDVPAPDTTPTYVAVYTQLLHEQVPVMGGSDITQYYALYDIDLDGIPECLIEQGWGQDYRTCDVYTAVGSEAVYLGSFHTNFSVIYGEQNGGLTVMSGQDGMETCRSVSLSGGQLQDTTLYMSMVDVYWNEICAVQPLPLYALGDTMGLHWTGNPNYSNWMALEPALARVFP